MKKFILSIVLCTGLIGFSDELTPQEYIFQNGVHAVTNVINESNVDAYWDYGVSVTNRDLLNIITYRLKLKSVDDRYQVAKSTLDYGNMSYAFTKSSNDVWRLEIADMVIADTKFYTNNVNFVYNILIWNGYLRDHSDVVLRYANDALIRGDYVLATLPFKAPVLSRNTWIESRGSDYDAYLSANYKTIALNTKGFNYASLMNYALRFDLSNKDKSNTKGMEIYRPEFNHDGMATWEWDTSCGDYIYFTRSFTDYVNNTKNYRTYFNHIFKLSKKLDIVRKDKSFSESIYPKVISQCSNIQKLNFSLYLDDINKIIDVLSNDVTGLDADSINKIIPVINALDDGYRKDDVLKILKNINKKYTIKLYDDRATWEPIISKVRAMIDVM